MRPILYATKALYEDHEIQVLDPKAIAAVIQEARGHHFEWTQAVGPITSPILAGYDPAVRDSLVICMTELGLSVFTSAPISKGTPLCVYAGELVAVEDLDEADRYIARLNDEVFDTLYVAAESLGDEEAMRELARDMHPRIHGYTSMEEPLEKRVQRAYARIVSMPDDYWHCLRPKDRSLIRKFLQTNGIYVDKMQCSKVLTNPHSDKMLARFKHFSKGPASTAPLFRELSGLQLAIPEALTTRNAARFYVGYLAVSASTAATLIRQHATAGTKSYKEKNYASAIDSFQTALRLARDALSVTDRSGQLSTAKQAGAGGGAVAAEEVPCELLALPSENAYYFDKNVIHGFWNLGNAYNKAGDLAEAEYCLAMAVAMIKASSRPEITELLTKYEDRLGEVRTAISVHASAFGEAAGGAGAASAAP